MMIFQSSAVGEILLGRDAGWQVQRRDDGVVPIREVVRKYAVPTVFGVLMAISAYAVSLPLFLWMTPVIVGLWLSMPLAIVSSRALQPGQHARLFATPGTESTAESTDPRKRVGLGGTDLRRKLAARIA